MNTVKCVVAKSCTYIPDENNVGKFISLEINMNILINPLLLFKPHDAANNLLETVGLRMSPLKIQSASNCHPKNARSIVRGGGISCGGKVANVSYGYNIVICFDDNKVVDQFKKYIQ